MMDADHQLSYMAGFFDGEGCIHIGYTNKEHTGYRLMVSVSQQDPAPLELYAGLFGGYNIKRVNRPSGWAYTWRAYSWAAGDCLTALLPYLVVKRDEALVGLAFQGRRMKQGQHRPGAEHLAQDEAAKQELHSIKARRKAGGCALPTQLASITSAANDAISLPRSTDAQLRVVA